MALTKRGVFLCEQTKQDKYVLHSWTVLRRAELRDMYS